MNSGDGIAVGWLNILTLLIGKLIVNRINFRKPNRFLMSQFSTNDNLRAIYRAFKKRRKKT